jgi:hypothetical protein
VCQGCLAGTYSITPGASSSGTCTACSIGTYNPSSMATACTACPTSSSTPSTGSTQRGNCLCFAGFYGDLASGSCTACPANSYCPGGLTKFNCPANTYSLAQSSVYTHCRCYAGWRCSYTNRRDVRLRFTFNLNSAAFLAQLSEIKAKLAKAADVPVSLVTLE